MVNSVWLSRLTFLPPRSDWLISIITSLSPLFFFFFSLSSPLLLLLLPLSTTPLYLYPPPTPPSLSLPLSVPPISLCILPVSFNSHCEPLCKYHTLTTCFSLCDSPPLIEISACLKDQHTPALRTPLLVDSPLNFFARFARPLQSLPTQNYIRNSIRKTRQRKEKENHQQNPRSLEAFIV